LALSSHGVTGASALSWVCCSDGLSAFEALMIKRQRKAILFVLLACLVVLVCTAQRMAGMLSGERVLAMVKL
jgi:hypothetical protein